MVNCLFFSKERIYFRRLNFIFTYHIERAVYKCFFFTIFSYNKAYCFPIKLFEMEILNLFVSKV